jgi:septal ring factor EnvC (AmiA/AmiB activator)
LQPDHCIGLSVLTWLLACVCCSSQLNRKFKIMNHQIEQLKEEMQRKDNALIDEQFAFKKLQEENNLFHRKLTKSKEVLSDAAKVLASQDAEIKNLKRTIQEVRLLCRLGLRFPPHLSCCSPAAG